MPFNRSRSKTNDKSDLFHWLKCNKQQRPTQTPSLTMNHQDTTTMHRQIFITTRRLNTSTTVKSISSCIGIRKSRRTFWPRLRAKPMDLEKRATDLAVIMFVYFVSFVKHSLMFLVSDPTAASSKRRKRQETERPTTRQGQSC